MAYEVDLYKYLLSGEMPSNIQLRDQDVVFVPPRLSNVQIDSAVVNQGVFEILENETIYDLIQYAGGLTYDASGDIGVFAQNHSMKIILLIAHFILTLINQNSYQ